MRNVKYVDINDIEDVVLTKHEIDIKLIEMKEQESKMKLEEFYMRYCNLDIVLMTDTYKQIPFSISFVYDMIYVFVSKMTDEDKDLLEKNLSEIGYRIESLDNANRFNIVNESGNLRKRIFIKNNSYLW